MSVLKKIKMMPLALNQYFREQYKKTQIYLHHTAGYDNGPGVLQWWGKTQTRVATCVVIERDGDAFQGFSSKYWAYHLGLKGSVFRFLGIPYLPLDKYSIGIELTCLGGLIKKNGKFYTDLNGDMKADNVSVDKEEVIDLGKKYRGYRYWHSLLRLRRIWREI